MAGLFFAWMESTGRKLAISDTLGLGAQVWFFAWLTDPSQYWQWPLFGAVFVGLTFYAAMFPGDLIFAFPMQRIHAPPPERQIDFAQSDFEADRTLKAMDARPARISRTGGEHEQPSHHTRARRHAGLPFARTRQPHGGGWTRPPLDRSGKTALGCGSI